MSCFSVASSRRDVALIEIGYNRAILGLHIERARIESSASLRATLVKIARDANHKMIAAKREAKVSP